MPYDAYWTDQDARTAGTICHDIYLATLGAAEILLVFFSAVLHAQVQPLKYTANGGAVTSCLEL